jgi:hypothetical protein
LGAAVCISGILGCARGGSGNEKAASDGSGSASDLISSLHMPKRSASCWESGITIVVLMFGTSLIMTSI